MASARNNKKHDAKETRLKPNKKKPIIQNKKLPHKCILALCALFFNFSVRLSVFSMFTRYSPALASVAIFDLCVLAHTLSFVCVCAPQRLVSLFHGVHCVARFIHFL
eukprot:GEMP01082269.1.p1 GENE.GEMP01082269.1~~GEMP01082269.1.p1  ORF type:complete len:107 (+),score=6.34 GEMP01082269.1:324-644(+)